MSKLKKYLPIVTICVITLSAVLPSISQTI